MFSDAPIIATYTRSQALEDGELVAADPELLSDAGFRFPVAYTRAVHADCVAWADADTDRAACPQDATGRAWDVLMLLRAAIARANGSAQVSFPLSRIDRASGALGDVELCAVCGPGDAGEPVITVMFPGED